MCDRISGSEMYKRDCCVYIKEAESWSDDLPEAEPEGDKATCPKLPLEWSATATIGVVCHCHWSGVPLEWSATATTLSGLPLPPLTATRPAWFQAEDQDTTTTLSVLPTPAPGQD